MGDHAWEQFAKSSIYIYRFSGLPGKLSVYIYIFTVSTDYRGCLCISIYFIAFAFLKIYSKHGAKACLSLQWPKHMPEGNRTRWMVCNFYALSINALYFYCAKNKNCSKNIHILVLTNDQTDMARIFFYWRRVCKKIPGHFGIRHQRKNTSGYSPCKFTRAKSPGIMAH